MPRTDDSLSGVLLCAGLGSRLRPLTFQRPKALVPLHGIALAEFGLRLLQEAGCRRIALNACHLAGQLEDWTAALPARFPGVTFSCHRETELLGTGGGLRAMLEQLPPGPVLVHNGDVIHDCPLKRLCNADPNRARLLVQQAPCVVEVDQGRVLGFRDPLRSTHGFAGVHWMGQAFRARLLDCRQADLIESWQEMQLEGWVIQAEHHTGLWEDLGRVGDYLPLHMRLGASEDYHALCRRLELKPDWDDTLEVSASALESHPDWRTTVLWPGARWTGASLESIITCQTPGSGTLKGEIVL
ncbi:MAG: NTP transferase domain-containing protein [Candidatus Cloacimonetes bacterium]|nr:NTP transferase domain-containing protein [Candidatus Cloacimonadota bacterium]